MKRILIVQQYAVPPSVPGGTRQYELAKLLNAHEWQTEISCSDFSHSEKKYFRRTRSDRRRSLSRNEDGVLFTYSWIPSYEKNDIWRAISMAWFSLKTLTKVLTAHHEIVYASSPHIFGSVAALIAAKVRRKRFVLEVRDLWPEYLGDPDENQNPSIQYRFLGYLAGLLYRNADIIVIFAEGSREVVIRRGGHSEKIMLVSGINPSSVVPTPVVRNTTNGPTRFVYVGSLGDQYGLEMLIEACGLLEARGDVDFHVTLVGAGPERARLEALATELRLKCVSFYGSVPKDKVAPLLMDSGVGLNLVRPSSVSSYAISPQKMFDYMAVGLPIVSNVIGDSADLIRAADAGLTATTADASALAHAMQSMSESLLLNENAYSGGPSYLLEHANRQQMSLELEAKLCALVGEVPVTGEEAC